MVDARVVFGGRQVMMLGDGIQVHTCTVLLIDYWTKIQRASERERGACVSLSHWLHTNTE
jgi:hypothetical protein